MTRIASWSAKYATRRPHKSRCSLRLRGTWCFTTVHANGVLDVFSRFLQFDIDAYALSSAINGILAQRLVRKLCPVCARAATSAEQASAVELGIGAGINRALDRLRAPVALRRLSGYWLQRSLCNWRGSQTDATAAQSDRQQKSGH